MKNLLFKVFGMHRVKKWYLTINLLTSPGYGKAFRETKKRFHTISETKIEELRNSLQKNYFVDTDYLATDIGRKDIEERLVNRLTGFRNKTIPWLNSLVPLSGVRILEIGCGTGSMTVPLAEQGANLIRAW